MIHQLHAVVGADVRSGKDGKKGNMNTLSGFFGHTARMNFLERINSFHPRNNRSSSFGSPKQYRILVRQHFPGVDQQYNGLGGLHHCSRVLNLVIEGAHQIKFIENYLLFKLNHFLKLPHMWIIYFPHGA